MAADPVRTRPIEFQNHRRALVVFPSSTDTAADVLAALDIKSYGAVLLILGGANSIDEKSVPRLTQLFSRGIARAAVDTEALIIDGATSAGVIALMGEGVAARGYKTPLLGVAPASLVTLPGDSVSGVPLEPNHSHVVLVEGNDWGSETAMLFELTTLATQRTPQPGRAAPLAPARDAEKPRRDVPALAVLVGGGAVSRDEVLRAVRHNLPIIVVEGSGGLADEIAAAWRQKPTLPDDPVMAEIAADGEIHLQLLSNPVNTIERLIIRELGVDAVLTQAWEIFADYDLNATLQQRRFSALQFSILAVGVITTAAAICQQVFAPRDDQGALKIVRLITDAGGHWSTTGPFGFWFLRQSLIILPIVLTVLVTAANRFKQGSKWLLLRAGAESIKREIYRYRTRAMSYKATPEQQLSQRVEDITRRTMRTEVNLSALSPYDKTRGFPPYMDAAQGGDDGFSLLTPDRYVEIRLGDQLAYFRHKAVGLERTLTALYWLTFIVGGLGTYLAAIDQQGWVALTTAVVAAIGTYLGYRQTEATLTKYNQAATDLANVKAWWNALSAEEQSQQQNIDSLVEHTEVVLQSELDGWVQQMQNALAEMRKDQAAAPEKEEHADPEVAH